MCPGSNCGVRRAPGHGLSLKQAQAQGGGAMQERLEADSALISEAAAALDTSEIAIFRRAWVHWYGVPAVEARVEPLFLIYMFGGRAPSWVRDYARRIVARHRDQPLDPYDWGSRSGYARNPLLGFALAVLAVVVVIALVIAADYSAQFITGLEGCFTPPCYGTGPATGR